jgi:hypothetical protein
MATRHRVTRDARSLRLRLVLLLSLCTLVMLPSVAKRFQAKAYDPVACAACGQSCENLYEQCLGIYDASFCHANYYDPCVEACYNSEDCTPDK